MKMRTVEIEGEIVDLEPGDYVRHSLSGWWAEVLSIVEQDDGSLAVTLVEPDE